MRMIPPTDPRLWVAVPHVTDIETQVRPHVARLRKILLRGGYGLGATQVGLGHRFFVMRGPPIEFVINPAWWPLDGNGHTPFPDIVNGNQSFPSEDMVEGCLTWPERYIIKTRFAAVCMKWTNLEGKLRGQCFDGILARLVQHECDHLDGGCIFPRPDGSNETNPAVVGSSEAKIREEWNKRILGRVSAS